MAKAQADVNAGKSGAVAALQKAQNDVIKAANDLKAAQKAKVQAVADTAAAVALAQGASRKGPMCALSMAPASK